ncbi:Glucose-methanol-choline oxidoreductase [Botryosphaeria dothidea]|uniref:Glucose-methanol-choline oxidoreductase n=1 Tax=Botryosphaeria dothidea TaxID=55169 RepID=A0A8H4ISD3_9PEZI|nr:Glucose-methanol-choline oxidoreductase [Botryosphaeria dothidea]KAF4305527.1 Glucose-methanol-choline oxidoreductase [Botryosphaeria dothidea]
MQGRGMKSLFLLCTWLAGTIEATHNQHNHFHQHASRQASNVTALEDYEYVIIGSGPGGGPLAARLAIAGYKTLLIEAGDDQGEDLKERVPAFHGQSSEYEPMRWDFWVRHYDDDTKQARDSKCTYDTPEGELYTGLTPPEGSKMKGVLYPRAGTLGGCGSHNAMVTIYPHEQDWEYLVNITGDASWGADNMRKYFQKLEKAEYLLGNALVGHGTNGWLTTGTTDLTLVLEDAKLLQMVLAAATALGRGLLEQLITTVTGLAELLLQDVNIPGKARDQNEGLYQVPLAIKNYARNGPRDFVLEVANSGKYPLDIRTNCFATKLRFENDTTTGQPRAVGVDFLDGKALYRADPRAGNSAGGIPGSVNATREVIVSGGVFNTPQLLKLSGIGPADELAKFGIPVVKDLPGVGTNLQDRYEVATTIKFDGNFTVIEDCTYGQPGDPCLERWLNNAVFKGVYGSSGLALSAIMKSSTASSEDPTDLINLGVPANFPGYMRGYSDYAVADSSHWSWLTLKAHTRNRAGYVKLRSADPLDTPQISFRYFDEGDTANGEDEADLQAVYEGVTFSRKIYESMSPTIGDWVDVRPPSRDEEATKQFIKDEAWGHHASCTAPIGADDDPNAVLDGDFRVRGVSGLRVVDASAMPRIHGFFIASSVYMFSEKAADVIIAEAQSSA